MLARRFSLRFLFGCVVMAALACVGLRWVAGFYVQPTGVPLGDASTIVDSLPRTIVLSLNRPFFGLPALSAPADAWREAAPFFQYGRPIPTEGYYCECYVALEVQHRGETFAIVVQQAPEFGVFGVARRDVDGQWLPMQTYKSLSPDAFGAAVRRLAQRISLPHRGPPDAAPRLAPP